MDGSLRIEAEDRAGRERLLPYCAGPPFALDGLRELDPERLLYDNPKPGPDARGALILTALELLDRIAALLPPPRIHRRRYFVVLAPNARLCATGDLVSKRLFCREIFQSSGSREPCRVIGSCIFHNNQCVK